MSIYKGKKNEHMLNAVTAVLVLALTTLFNFMLTPFFINKLGVDGLAIVRISLSIPVYIGLISLAMMGTFSRFLTVELSNNNYHGAQEVFGTSFYSIIFLFLFLLFISYILFLFFLPYFHDLEQYKSLFAFMFLFAFFSTVSFVFTLPAYAKNKQVFYNSNKLIAIIFQSSFIFLLLSISPEISYVGMSFFIGSLASLIFSIYCFRKFSNDMNIKFVNFSFSKAFEMFSVSKWIFIDSVGVLFLLTIDLVLINFYYDSTSSGEYSIFLQMLVATFAISKAISGLFGPKIYSFYAVSDKSNLQKFELFSILSVGLVLGLLIGFIMAFSKPILRIWLGEDLVHLSLFLSIGLALFPVIFATNIFSFSFNACLKVKTPAIFTLSCGLAHFIMVNFLARYSELHIWGVFSFGM